MGVKRAKKLSEKELEQVEIIRKRYELIDQEYINIGKYKLEQTKKLINKVINPNTTTEELLELGKIDVFIDKKKEELRRFILDTEEQNKLLGIQLQKEYGEGTINPEKGTFIPK